MKEVHNDIILHVNFVIHSFYVLFSNPFIICILFYAEHIQLSIAGSKEQKKYLIYRMRQNLDGVIEGMIEIEHIFVN